MAIDDKKHYKTCLKLLSTTATGTNLANKLSDLSIDTDDLNLQHMAKGLADLVRPKIGEKDAKVNILELAHRFKCRTGPGHKQRGLAIDRSSTIATTRSCRPSPNGKSSPSGKAGRSLRRVAQHEQDLGSLAEAKTGIGKTMKTNAVFNLQLMQRALVRSDAELGIFRKHYEARAFELAAKIIAGNLE